jgi:hypothetical protein
MDRIGVANLLIIYYLEGVVAILAFVLYCIHAFPLWATGAL